jgi:hypothetical protein
MPVPFRSLGLLAVAPVLLALASSAPAADKDDATVEGVVTLDGKPLAAGEIIFHPEKGKPVKGKTDADGKYTGLKMPAGTASVVIKGDGVPKKYADPKTTPMRVEVQSGKFTADFVLEK